MSLVDSQSRNFISPAFGKRKAELELEEEEKRELEGEGEVEEEEVVVVEENGGESEEEEEYELCGVCLKDKEHWTDECPYLKSIPNPTEVTLGNGFEMCCKYCHRLGGHPDVAGVSCRRRLDKWVGRAIYKVCTICRNFQHDYRDCPLGDNLPEKN